MNCPKCGAQIADNATNCLLCGQTIASVENSNISDPDPTPPPAQQPQTQVYQAIPISPEEQNSAVSSQQQTQQMPPAAASQPQGTTQPQSPAYTAQPQVPAQLQGTQQMPPAYTAQPQVPAQPQSPVYTGQPQAPQQPDKKPLNLALIIILVVVTLILLVFTGIALVNSLADDDAAVDTIVTDITEAAPEEAIPSEPTAPPAEMESDTTESSEPDFGTGTIVGSWTNIMTEGGFASMEFTEDGRFTIVNRDGTSFTGTYTITSGTPEEGTILCDVSESSIESIDGEFHLNGNILTFGTMMFQRDE